MISLGLILKLLASETPYNLLIVYDNYVDASQAFKDIRRHILDEDITVSLKGMSLTKGETTIGFRSCVAPNGINNFLGLDSDFLIMDDLAMSDELFLRQRANWYWGRRR